MNLFLVMLSVFIFNIPFGYWRTNVKQFSIQWALAIHIPVPFIILLRIYYNIGFEFFTYPILIGAFFFGQFFGKLLSERRKKISAAPITSCLVMDLYRSYVSN